MTRVIRLKAFILEKLWNLISKKLNIKIWNWKKNQSYKRILKNSNSNNEDQNNYYYYY